VLAALEIILKSHDRGSKFGTDELGCMKFRYASINDQPIKESERKFRWERKGQAGKICALGAL